MTKRFTGSGTVLIGGAPEDASANAAPFDVRYSYVVSRPAPSSDYYSASRSQDAWTNRLDLLTLYMNDYRFFLQKIGKSHDMIDIEPDFWGFARTFGNLA